MGWKLHNSYGSRRTAESVADALRRERGYRTKLGQDKHGNNLVYTWADDGVRRDLPDKYVEPTCNQEIEAAELAIRGLVGCPKCGCLCDAVDLCDLCKACCCDH